MEGASKQPAVANVEQFMQIHITTGPFFFPTVP